MCAGSFFFPVSLTQAVFIWEEGISVNKMPPLFWHVGRFVGHFKVYIPYGKC